MADNETRVKYTFSADTSDFNKSVEKMRAEQIKARKDISKPIKVKNNDLTKGMSELLDSAKKVREEYDNTSDKLNSTKNQLNEITLLSEKKNAEYEKEVSYLTVCTAKEKEFKSILEKQLSTTNKIRAQGNKEYSQLSDSEKEAYSFYKRLETGGENKQFSMLSEISAKGADITYYDQQIEKLSSDIADLEAKKESLAYTKEQIPSLINEQTEADIEKFKSILDSLATEYPELENKFSKSYDLNGKYTVGDRSEQQSPKSIEEIETSLDSLIAKITLLQQIKNTLESSPNSGSDEIVEKIREISKVIKLTTSQANSLRNQLLGMVNSELNTELQNTETKLKKTSEVLNQYKTRTQGAKESLKEFVKSLSPLNLVDSLFAGLLSLPLKAAQAIQNFGAKAKSVAVSAITAPFNLAKKAVHGLFSAFKNIAGKTVTAPFRMIKSGVSGIVNGFKNASKGVRAFNKRLKSTVVQGLLLRPMRNALTKITEGFTEALKKNQQFNSALGNLKGTLYTALAPAFEAIVPVISSVMNYIAKLITYISTLVSYLGFLPKASKKAGKALENSAESGSDQDNFASWDTIQKLSAGSGDTTAGTYEQDFTEAETALSSLQEAVKNGWYAVGMEMGSMLNNLFDTVNTWLEDKLVPMFGSFGTEVSNWMNGLIEGFDFSKLGNTLAQGLNAVTELLTNFATNFDFSNFGENISDSINGFFENYNFESLATGISAWAKGFMDTLSSIFEHLDFQQIGTSINNFFNNIDWSGLAQSASRLVTSFFTALKNFFANVDWYSIGQDIKTFLSNIDWAGIAESVFSLLGSALGALASFLWGLVEDAFAQVVDWWNSNALNDEGKFTIEGLFQGIIDAFTNIKNWIKEHIFQPFIDGFKEIFDIHSPSKVMEEQGGYVIEGMLEGILDAFSSIGTWIKTNIFDPFINGVKSAFGFASGVATNIKTQGTAIIRGLYEGICDKISNIGSWIKENIFTPFMKGFKSKFGTSDGDSTELKSQGLSVIGGFFGGIVEKMSDIGSWVDTNIFQPFKSAFSKLFGTSSGDSSSEFKSEGTSVMRGLNEGITGYDTSAITSVFDKLKTAFTTTFGISSGISSATYNMGKAIMQGLTSGITSAKSAFVSALNNIINLVGSFVNGIVNECRSAIIALAKVSVASGKAFNGTMPATINPSSYYVKLAQGTVVNPSHEFAAILGDNRQEQEVVSPLSTMKQAFMEALSESNMSGNNATINLSIDGTKFASVITPYFKSQNRRLGTSAL